MLGRQALVSIAHSHLMQPVEMAGGMSYCRVFIF